ncbi:hypothetical protein ACVXHB_23460 [Escherichia coli]
MFCGLLFDQFQCPLAEGYFVHIASINYCQLQAIIVPVLIIPAVNNVDDVEMTRRHGDEIHL